MPRMGENPASHCLRTESQIYKKMWVSRNPMWWLSQRSSVCFPGVWFPADVLWMKIDNLSWLHTVDLMSYCMALFLFLDKLLDSRINFNLFYLLQQISDEGIVKICRGCHRLQSLCVSGCSNLTDASLTALGLNCPRLKWVCHSFCIHHWPDPGRLSFSYEILSTFNFHWFPLELRVFSIRAKPQPLHIMWKEEKELSHSY